ncbi:hypothetical protein ME763_32210 [Streptomyces murinus]|uniref:hypothetical protein n=1 Tax=Streptomyces murinus TaxID=33900 RepID=UPI000A1FD05A|nr:hypothetical protein [Streptomyces murinus]WDO09955.1 hypothetical protein ME763_32210 [Streptomyces murinus]
MKIRMKTDVSGSRDGQPWPRRGSTLEVPDAEGADLCKAGIAEPVAKKDAEAVEKATPPDDAEQRQAADDDQQPQQQGPVTTESAPAVAKTTARKSAAKKTAPSAPAKD